MAYRIAYLKSYRNYAPAVGLGITQVIGYGSLMYAYAVLLPAMAQDLELSYLQLLEFYLSACLSGELCHPSLDYWSTNTVGVGS